MRPGLRRDWRGRRGAPIFDDLSKRATIVRSVLDACASRMDGKPAAATTARRKRAVFHNALGRAVELGHLSTNPVTSVQWKAPKVADEVDRRVVPTPLQMRRILTAVTYVGRMRGPRLAAFFALLYFAALRPAEAMALTVSQCELPKKGWGQLLLAESWPEAGSAWTDDGQGTEKRSLKWRGKKEVRPVPIPAELVSILRSHIDTYGTGPGGVLFRTCMGKPYTTGAYTTTWQHARGYAMPPAVAASPLAARPYDLRHGGVTLWLNSGVPAAEVARRAGHSVDVLLKIYAGCMDGEADSANKRIERALR